MLGLTFSMMGDVFMEVYSEGKPSFFIYGLGAFLIGHVFYIVGFFRDSSRSLSVFTDIYGIPSRRQYSSIKPIIRLPIPFP